MRLRDRFRQRRALASLSSCVALSLLLSACISDTSPAASRSPTRATGSHVAAPPVDPLLAHAGLDYHRYVDGQLEALLTTTGTLARAVRAGHVRTARLLYPRARIHYERIEPVAEIWGQLDLAVDGRANDFVPLARFSGFHRLEQALWASPAGAPKLSSRASDDRVAANLVSNLDRLRHLAASTSYTLLEMTSGASELLNEIESTKITGEEERYSHLDLVDISANVTGCLRIITLLAPYLRKHSPQLMRTLDQRAAVVTTALRRLRVDPGADDTGYPNFDDLGQTQRRTLSNDIEALAEPVSLMTAATSH